MVVTEQAFEYGSNGEEYEGSEEGYVPYPSAHLKRGEVGELPVTVTRMTSLHGGAVYIVGTAHFSTSSQEDVAKVNVPSVATPQPQA